MLNPAVVAQYVRAGLAETTDVVDVEVLDPDSPHDVPLFEGPSDEAHKYLVAGDYAAMVEPAAEAVVVRVGDRTSTVLRWPAHVAPRAAAPAAR